MSSSTPTVPSKKRRILRRVLITTASLAVALTIFYNVESYRGEAAWKAVKAEVEAKGRSLKWEDYTPQAVPDADNMLKDPQIDEWFVKGKDADSWHNLLKLSQDLAKSLAQPLAVGSLTLTAPQEGKTAPLADSLATAVKATAAAWIEGAIAFPQIVKDPPPLTHLARLRHDQLPPLQLNIAASPTTPAADVTKALASVLGPYTVEARATATPGRFDLFLVKSSALATADFLAFTDNLQPRFDAILNAARRPGAYLTGNYAYPLAMPMPKFNPVRQASRCLGLRLQAHLLNGQPDKALQDLAGINAVRKTLAKPELTLVASMMDTVIQGLIFDTVQNGFTLHIWRAEDMATLETHALTSKSAATVFKSLNSEPLWCVGIMENYFGDKVGQGTKTFQDANNALGREGLSTSDSMLIALIPSGWVKQNVANIVRPISAVVDSYDTVREVVSPEKYAYSQKLVAEEIDASGPYHYFSKAAMPAFDRVLHQSARIQTQAGLTVLGCALERHRLDTGSYPEKLESLTPKYLAKAPAQTVNGEPFLYRHESDGGYSLWSVGWDLRDDGGKFTVGDPVKEEKADWGWRMQKP